MFTGRPRLPGWLIPVCALAFAGESAPVPDTPDPGWRQGPVRYILLSTEDQEYRSLKTDEARRAFIERFWGTLDPDPSTAVNERRVEFWNRVEVADARFHEGLTPGWRSDRGKVYVLLGPPDRRRPGPADEIWWYHALPKAGADPEIMIRFRRNSEGEYHMGRGALEYWDPVQESDGPAAGDTFLAVRTKRGVLEMMHGRMRMTDFPRPAVSAEAITAPLPVQPRFDYFRTEEGGTRVTLSFTLPVDTFRSADGRYAAPDIWVSAALEDARSGKTVGTLSEPVRVADIGSEAPKRPMLFQGAFTIDPGTYKAALTILDRHSHRGLTRVETIEVPDLKRDLALSSVVVGRMPEEKPTTLTPDPGAEFLSGETLSLTFQVYNARLKDGAPDLHVEYQLIVPLAEGPRPVGGPIVLAHQTSPSLAYSLSLQGWPAGRYQVRIRVTDNATNAAVTRDVSFRVVTPAP